jgi:7,8-dihydropterin-6-yl-methyl-4-(beta-D-ribofuranosyl)aminobenzene 5'-phosphate synthase
MQAKSVGLEQVDSVEITTLMDNYIDLLMVSSEVARQPRLGDTLGEEQTRLIGEHGFCALVTVTADGRRESILFDAGLSPDGVLHNIDILEDPLADVRAIVLSHGHADHTGALVGLLRRLGKRGLPLIAHPDAFLQRKLVLPNGREVKMPPPDRGALLQEGVALIEGKEPSLLLDKRALVTGQVARTTGFEKGFPIHHALVDGRWQPDPWIYDDQALVFHLRGKGLAILTGCGHAGVINIIRHARNVTGIENVYALIGGFHLTGPLFEAIIPQTVEELKRVAPRVVVPTHCTGWKAVHAIARAMPQAFIQNSVGTRYVL